MKQPDPALRLQLLERARIVAAQHGWDWRDPVEFTRVNLDAWQIRTNATSRGMNIRIVIRESNFAILEAGYLPR